ncbi:antibiotic biosynthesis monooxygenase family protein [Nakamurella sp.]|uniref:antibiotic biosynthesis monooxygenase family protein n=1 Tax=Nakamurella sp. TaxID=1869182 RepID=UPI0037843BBC
MDAEGRGRVVFVITLKPGSTERFIEAYEQIRHEVARGVTGHLIDQVCQSPDHPDEWLITSEWRTIDDFRAWERSPDHRTVAAPLRACIATARSLQYVVRAETTARSGT